MKLEDIYKEVCNGNEEALKFLLLWNVYVHRVDDVIDDKCINAEKIIRAFQCAAEVFSLPFYQHYLAALFPIVCIVTNMYLDSVQFATSEIVWKTTVADTLRFAGNEMVNAIAMICGGFDHMRKYSAILRETSWQDHHDKNNNPI